MTVVRTGPKPGKQKVTYFKKGGAAKSKGSKICPAGKAWAKRTFDTYPSAYANLAASKYCKDPNYGKGRGKDAKNEELDPLLEEEEEDSVDLSDHEVYKLKKVQGQ